MNDLRAGERVPTIDVLRGITILTMIFVNDVAGVANVPAWMKHFHPSDGDGMTFVDVVFPAFLFIVGMSIPFAIGRRLESGEPLFPILRHVLIRTAGLLVVGVMMVNETAEANWAGPIPQPWWRLLMYVCVILAWNVPPKEHGVRRNVALTLRGVGIAGLLILAAIYRRADGSWLRHEWWGILGLIGWAYVVAVMFYMMFRKNIAALVGIMAMLYVLYLVDGQKNWTGVYLRGFVNLGGMLGSHPAITLSGVILGMMLREDSPVQGDWARLRWATLYATGLALAGLLLYRLHDVPGIGKSLIINKNAATPPWSLLCSAITVGVWVVLHVVMEIFGWRKWTTLFKPAGENPLLAYLLAPLLFNFMVVTGLLKWYGMLGHSFASGFARSLVFAFAMTWLAGFLKSRGVRLRL